MRRLFAAREIAGCLTCLSAAAAADLPITPADTNSVSESWNWHAQSTVVAQANPRFTSAYEGVHSLPDVNSVRETVSFDLTGAVSLWSGAAAFADALVWQGYGLGNTYGIEAFPSGEAYRLGTTVPNINLARLFLRQSFGLGGERETVAGDALNLSGQRDVNRLTFTVGKLSAKDIFDNNAYANNPRTQFMDWSLYANDAWDYPADSLGYITGAAVELNQRDWAVRYGFFEMPRVANGVAIDPAPLRAWGMVTEFEWRYALGERPGTVRLLGFLNRAHMGSYAAAVDGGPAPADITLSREYRYKYGGGLNWDQAVGGGVGVFARVGWGDGQNESWAFNDVDRTATAGFSVRGGTWGRAADTFGFGGGFNGLSKVHQEFLAAGGTGILAGDGNLNYGWEQFFETFYDCGLTRWLHASAHYELVASPAFNRDRGPVHVFGLRVHMEF